MKNRTGQLTEISPWGTGFIKEVSGQVFGFHCSMLDGYEKMPQANWAVALESKFVSFTEVNGTVVKVALQASASAGPSLAAAAHSKAAS